MLASRFVQRKVLLSPHLNKRFFFTKKTQDEVYGNSVALCASGGGIIGAGAGIYHGYTSYRHQSYAVCAIQTTLNGFIGAGLGLCGGALFGLTGPIVIPILCMGIPVAGGAVVVKYFDKSAKSS
jgi:hypothetical protein